MTKPGTLRTCGSVVRYKQNPVMSGKVLTKTQLAEILAAALAQTAALPTSKRGGKRR